MVCEVSGIILGLEIGIKCIHDCKNKKQIRSIYVFSDCDSAIKTVAKYPDIHQKLESSESTASADQFCLR